MLSDFSFMSECKAYFGVCTCFPIIRVSMENSSVDRQNILTMEKEFLIRLYKKFVENVKTSPSHRDNVEWEKKIASTYESKNWFMGKGWKNLKASFIFKSNVHHNFEKRR